MRVSGKRSVAVIPLSDRVDLLQGNVDGCVAVVHVVMWDWREALARQSLRVGASHRHVNSESALAGVRGVFLKCRPTPLLLVKRRLCRLGPSRVPWRSVGSTLEK